MGSNRRKARETIGRPGQAGFTLIEVLVVVAIIALLLSILLPSLKQARDQAQSAVCKANLGQMTRAENGYQTEHKGWMPGSPLTTGFWWAKSGQNIWHPFITHPTAGRFNRFVIEWFDFATPLRAQNQGRSTIPAAQSAATVTATQGLIWKLATEEPFHCPANKQIATPYNGSGPQIKAVSYLSTQNMMRGGPGFYAEAGGRGYLADPNSIGQSPNWEVVPPTAYMPRHERAGRESMKVFAADGLRFYAGDDATGPTITYNVRPAEAKGTMTGESPAKGGFTDPAHAREYRMARRFSYRHGDNNQINAGFLDGHVEMLNVDYRSDPFRGSSVHPKYWYPSGSVVKDPSVLHMRDIPAGTVLP